MSTACESFSDIPYCMESHCCYLDDYNVISSNENWAYWVCKDSLLNKAFVLVNKTFPFYYHSSTSPKRYSHHLTLQSEVFYLTCGGGRWERKEVRHWTTSAYVTSFPPQFLAYFQHSTSGRAFIKFQGCSQLQSIDFTLICIITALVYRAFSWLLSAMASVCCTLYSQASWE